MPHPHVDSSEGAGDHNSDEEREKRDYLMRHTFHVEEELLESDPEAFALEER